MNEILLFAGVIIAFGSMVLAKKLFGESGIIAYMVVAPILANIMATKSIDLFGIAVTAGCVMFSCTFLATDILTECYGKESAQKGLRAAVFGLVGFIIASQILTLYSPNSVDMAQEHIGWIFGFAPRISLASTLMFVVANYTDVKLYAWLKEKTNGKYMWFRNNICTIACNGVENFAFNILAFGGVYELHTLIEFAICGTIIETVIAVCDTPFLYMAKATTERRISRYAEQNTV